MLVHGAYLRLINVGQPQQWSGRGHFFGAAHTLERYQTSFYRPLLSDWRGFETWSEAGSPDAARNANRIWKQLLAEYAEPPIDPGVREALDAFLRSRRGEIERGGD